MTATKRPDRQPGDVLELRVHGVNNTSPASMLDLPADSIEEVLGDNLAGFWRPKPHPERPVRKGDRGWVPPEVTREAYSWGGLARTSTGGDGVGLVRRVTSALGRIGWALLLPFGLANVAYWSRQLGDEVRPAEVGRALRVRGYLPRRLTAPANGAGASTVRLFGLGLTVLSVVTACELSMDLIGTQCFRGTARVCGQLPRVFDALAPHPAAVRLALTSVPPVLLLLALWSLSAVTRSRYERAVSEGPPAAEPTGTEELPTSRPPLLALPQFWKGDRMVGGLADLHLAAGLAVVALSLGWPALFGTGEDCQQPAALVHSACWSQVHRQPGSAQVLFPVCVGAALLVLVWAAVQTWRRATDAPDLARDLAAPKSPSTTPVLVAAVVVLIATGISVVVVLPRLSAQIPLPGVSAFPTLVAVALFALVAGAFTARLDRTGPAWAGLVALTLLTVSLSRWFALAAIVVVAALVAYVLLLDGGRRGRRRWTAWAGTGPGLLLGTALLVEGMLASFVVLGAGDWLNGANSAASLIDGRSTSGAVTSPRTNTCGVTCPPPDPVLRVPMPYVLIGTATLIGLAAFLVIVAAMLVRTRKAVIPPAPLDPPPAPRGSPRDPSAPVPPGPAFSAEVQHRLQRTRLLAAIAHRAEPGVAIMVLSGLTTMFVVLILAVGGWVPWDPSWHNPPKVRRLTDLSTATVAVLSLVFLAALVGGAATAGKRPLGLIWDLICFLPRAAHPFGPPCYAERAVPELTSRVDWWLDQHRPDDGDDDAVDGQRRRGSRVVLSAHSLGGVLAVATLLARAPAATPGAPDVRLLTYGSQLRAYFSRIFPELLGPAVLGTPPARAPQFWATVDPWAVDAREADRPAPDPAATTVVAVLTTDAGALLWRSLWRRTDYLGLPIWSYPPPLGGPSPANPIDIGAEEIDRTGYLVEIVTHGEYPRSEAYEIALVDLVHASS